ncbi:MAG: hypothetical protein R3B60_03410 [Candidatus Paceibacterota bacterium]
MFGIDVAIIWMILGFLLAAYSVIANDSVQTLGTFIASNQKTRWYYLWGFASTILIITLSISYFTSGGDISSGRLEKIPFIQIEWYHALAPLALVLLTRVGIPVSTSLLVLSAFASSLVFTSILTKSALGYGIAALTAYVLWIVIFKWDNANNPVPEHRKKLWRIFQWLATGFLWYTWLSHDIANVAVFLPRELTLLQFILVLTIFVIGLAYIFWKKGGKIQQIVLEKKNTRYIRSATIIDLVYALILLIFKEWNSIPMSTTWVFVGLLSGRELAMSTWIKNYKFSDVFPLVGKDLLRLLFGLAISIAVALAIQHQFQIAGILSNYFGWV